MAIIGAPSTDSLNTLGTLGLLLALLPANLAVTTVALVRAAVVWPSSQDEGLRDTATPRAIMSSGGEVTKALHLARAFHAAWRRVILVESDKYWLTGHRFSRAVGGLYTVPYPNAEGYGQALRDRPRRGGRRLRAGVQPNRQPPRRARQEPAWRLLRDRPRRPGHGASARRPGGVPRAGQLAWPTRVGKLLEAGAD